MEPSRERYKTFKYNKAFNRILELIPLCEKVKKLTAVCWYCKKDNASFTKRTVKSKESKNN